MTEKSHKHFHYVKAIKVAATNMRYFARSIGSLVHKENFEWI